MIVNPDTRLSLSLVFTLAVSVDNLRGAAAGEVDILDVGFRFVVVFLATFFVVGVVGRVFNDYIRTIDERKAEEERRLAEEAAAEAEAEADRAESAIDGGRRRDDDDRRSDDEVGAVASS